MPDPRADRLAKNEAMFRVANERMSKWEESHPTQQAELYFCECADTKCREKIELGEGDYEGVRADSRQFFVVTGHEIPDVETVIERHEGWLVVEKGPEATALVEATDPRKGPNAAPAQ